MVPQGRCPRNDTGQLEGEAELIVQATPHADELAVCVVKMEVAGELLVGWRPNKVAIRLLLGVAEKFAWHRRRSLRRR